MTPAELQKELTLVLHDLLTDTGFSRKKHGWLWRKTGECRQFFAVSVSRVRGLPGNEYHVNGYCHFSFPAIDRLTCQFAGRPYKSGWHTGTVPLHLLAPDKEFTKYKYSSDVSLHQYAPILASDFRRYGLPFYDEWDSLSKLEAFFDKSNQEIMQEGCFVNGWRGNTGCCKAAALCLLERWEKLEQLLAEEDSLLLPEQKARVKDYLDRHA